MSSEDVSHIVICKINMIGKKPFDSCKTYDANTIKGGKNE